MYPKKHPRIKDSWMTDHRASWTCNRPSTTSLDLRRRDKLLRILKQSNTSPKPAPKPLELHRNPILPKREPHREPRREPQARESHLSSKDEKENVPIVDQENSLLQEYEQKLQVQDRARQRALQDHLREQMSAKARAKSTQKQDDILAVETLEWEQHFVDRVEAQARAQERLARKSLVQDQRQDAQMAQAQAQAQAKVDQLIEQVLTARNFTDAWSIYESQRPSVLAFCASKGLANHKRHKTKSLAKQLDELEHQLKHQLAAEQKLQEQKRMMDAEAQNIRQAQLEAIEAKAEARRIEKCTRDMHLEIDAQYRLQTQAWERQQRLAREHRVGHGQALKAQIQAKQKLEDVKKHRTGHQTHANLHRPIRPPFWIDEHVHYFTNHIQSKETLDHRLMTQHRRKRVYWYD